MDDLAVEAFVMAVVLHRARCSYPWDGGVHTGHARGTMYYEPMVTEEGVSGTRTGTTWRS